MKKFLSTIREMRKFLVLWFGQSFSALGSAMTAYALVIWSYSQEGSALMTALLMVCSYTPYVVFSIFAGTLADRWNKKALIILPDALIAVATVVLSLAIANGMTALAMFFVILAIRSAGAGVQSPAVQSFIPEITPEPKLLRVNSINGTIQSVNMIAAPAIAAVLVNIMPLWAILYVDVTTAVIGIVSSR